MISGVECFTCYSIQKRLPFGMIITVSYTLEEHSNIMFNEVSESRVAVA